MLLGELAPDSGTVRLGTRLEIAYFDQLRAHLDPEKNLIDNVCGGQDFIEIKGRKRHAISYLGEFMFAPDRVRMPVKALSGGEQNRAILARLFSKPANLLVLDEPTNDLDVETLELLEEILLDFDGTVLLVSHDRQFMDNVVTSIFVMPGNGEVEEYVGGYSSWAERGGRLVAVDQREKKSSMKKAETKIQVVPNPGANRPRKLSYKDQRELDALPELIEQLDSRLQELESEISAPDFYQQDHTVTQVIIEELEEVRSQLEAAYRRWEELESQSQGQ